MELTEKQVAREYLHNLKCRAQGQELMAKAGHGEDRTEEILEELGELSGIISKAYGHALAALAVRMQQEDVHGERKVAAAG